MKKIIYVCCILMASFFSFNASAEIYRSVDSHGVVTYSDQPNVDAEAVTLPTENIAKQPEKSATDAAAKSSTDTNDASTKTVEKKADYTAFAMSSPKDQETFQNQTEISLSVTVSPALQSGDLVQFYLDGDTFGNPSSSTSIVIPRSQNNREILTRGTHSIYAVIVNAEGNVIKTTSAVTIFVHYATIK